MNDPIIDRSAEQIRMRVQSVWIELAGYGYSVVRTEFLHSLMDRENEKANHSQVDRSKAGCSEKGKPKVA